MIKLIEAVEKLKAECDVPPTIKQVMGDKPETEWFYMSTTLDMSYQAFDDQCTGANPRYPLVRCFPVLHCARALHTTLQYRCIICCVSLTKVMIANLDQTGLHVLCHYACCDASCLSGLDSGKIPSSTKRITA